MPSKGYTQTAEHKKNISDSHKKSGFMPNPKYIMGSKNHKWKGKNAGYGALHDWIRRNFGKPTHCENKECVYKNPKRFEYALIKGKEHDHKRENYMMMCPSCHRKYDLGQPEKCLVNECNNKYMAKGMCSHHYNKEYWETCEKPARAKLKDYKGNK